MTLVPPGSHFLTAKVTAEQFVWNGAEQSEDYRQERS